MTHKYDDSDHDDQDDFDESSSDEENGFFDLEASEATSEAEPDEEHGLDAATATTDSFHKFSLLPSELQDMVWKAFCPDLTTNPRVFTINFIDNNHLMLGDGEESHIHSMRTLLAVNKQTRALSLKYSPHRLELPNGCGIVPYHLERDILFVVWPHTRDFFDNLIFPEPIELLARLADGLQNLAFIPAMDHFTIAGLDGLRSMHSLKNVFILRNAEDIITKGLAWCVADEVHEYHVTTQESEDAIGNPGPEVSSIYCWPDTQKYDETYEQEFNGRRLGVLTFDEVGRALDSNGKISANGDPQAAQWATDIGQFREAFATGAPDNIRPGSSEADSPGSSSGERDGDGEEESATGRRHIRFWPMALFNSEQEIQRFHDMKAWQEPWDDWQSEEESSDGLPDEYESDGIDDEPLDDTLITDDDDDLPAHLLETSSQTSDQIFGNTFDVGVPAAAQFSSDSELQDEDGRGSDPPLSVEEQTIRTRHSARRVIESDESEDESVTEAGSPPRKTLDRRARVVLDDNDEEDEGGGDEEDDAPQPTRGPRRRARPVPVGSEDDEEDDEAPPQTSRAANRRPRPAPIDSDDDDSEDAADHNEEVPAPRPNKRKARAVASSSSEGTSDPDDSSEEEPSSKRMSLRKRLRMEHRQAQASLPAPDSDGTEADGYGGASDDEEGYGDSSGEDGMIMGMAEEGDEDDEGDW